MSTRRLLARIIECMLFRTFSPILSIQLGIPLNRFFHLVVGQILFVAKRLDLKICRGNTLSDQEVLCSIDTPFRKDLVVFGGATWVGMAFQSQVGFRPHAKIFFEIAGQRFQDLLLTIEQAAGGVAERRPGRLKVDAVKGKPRF